MTNTLHQPHNHQTKNPPRPKLKLDHQGGARLNASTSQTLCVRLRTLRFLHISASTNLRELDLSRCAPGIEITLETSPQLTLIRLPNTGGGAVLHLNSCPESVPLEILGPIQSLDACWQGSSFAVDTQDEPPLINARLGQPPRTVATHHDIVIAYGAQAPVALTFVDDPQLRRLVVLNAPQLKTLQLPDARSLGQLQVDNCPALESIHGARVHRLQLSACQSLSRLAINGHAARLSANTGAADLCIEQPWSHLTLADSAVQVLHAPAVGDLLLRDCAQLRQAKVADQAGVTLSGNTSVTLRTLAQVRLDERAISGLLEQAQAGDAAARRMLEHWCSYVHRPGEYLDTLRALAAANNDPLYLWRLRCRLHARSNLGARRVLNEADAVVYAERHWNWRLPSDRYMEGWEADLAIWWRAHALQPELERMLRLQPPLLAIAALARQLTRSQTWTDQREQLICAGIRRARQRQQQVDQGMRMTDGLVFEILVSAAVSRHSQRMANAILARLHGDDQLADHLNVLASLAAFGHARARALLMRLAQAKDPELRARAISMALSPVRNNLFSKGGE